MEEFKIIIDGEEKTAKLVTRLSLDEYNVEYIYYYVKEDSDNDQTEKVLYASRVNTTEEGFDEIIEIQSEDEKKFALKIFQDTYDKADKEVGEK